jgi:hypothetical protein
MRQGKSRREGNGSIGSERGSREGGTGEVGIGTRVLGQSPNARFAVIPARVCPEERVQSRNHLELRAAVSSPLSRIGELSRERLDNYELGRSWDDLIEMKSAFCQ